MLDVQTYVGGIIRVRLDSFRLASGKVPGGTVAIMTPDEITGDIICSRTFIYDEAGRCLQVILIQGQAWVHV